MTPLTRCALNDRQREILSGMDPFERSLMQAILEHGGFEAVAPHWNSPQHREAAWTLIQNRALELSGERH